MRFIVDECTGPSVAYWLRKQQHDVFSVYEEARGMDDDVIVEKAFVENRILITCDKDFGNKVFREGCPHHGIILLRLENEQTPVKIETLNRLLTGYADQLTDQFVIITEAVVRFAKHRRY
jgi:predicted nuclease of predicted toxin-antitoxin system